MLYAFDMLAGDGEDLRSWPIALRKGGAPVTGTLGFKVFEEADLDKIKEFFEARELPALWIERPHQGRTLRAIDPQVTDEIVPVHPGTS